MVASPDRSAKTQPPWRRRIWGVDPRSVEDWAGEIWQLHVRELADLLAELRETKAQLAASEAAASEAAERVGLAERQLAALEEQRAERERRYREMRDDALAAIADAWVRAREIEGHAQLRLDQAYEQWRDEEIRLNHRRDQERQWWQGLLDALHSRQRRAIDAAEELARDLLGYAGALRVRAQEQADQTATDDLALPKLEDFWRDPQPPNPPSHPGVEEGPIATAEVPHDSDFTERGS